jgi:hypothetical protein
LLFCCIVEAFYRQATKEKKKNRYFIKVKMKITIHQEWDFTQIRINGVCHIELPKIPLALETWIDGTDGLPKFVIQFVNAKTGKIIVTGEYNSREKWVAIILLWQNRNACEQKKILKSKK